MERYKDIEIEIKLFYVKIDKVILEMEREWILFWKVVFGFYLGNLWIVFGFLIFLIWFVVFVIGFGVVVVVVVVVIFVFSVIFGWKRKISIEIGIEYNRYRMII